MCRILFTQYIVQYYLRLYKIFVIGRSFLQVYSNLGLSDIYFLKNNKRLNCFYNVVMVVTLFDEFAKEALSCQWLRALSSVLLRRCRWMKYISFPAWTLVCLTFCQNYGGKGSFRIAGAFGRIRMVPEIPEHLLCSITTMIKAVMRYALGFLRLHIRPIYRGVGPLKSCRYSDSGTPKADNACLGCSTDSIDLPWANREPVVFSPFSLLKRRQKENFILRFATLFKELAIVELSY